MLLTIYILYALAVSAVMARRGYWSRTSPSGKSSGRPIRRLLVIGATGGTGQHLVAQALELGYEVTAFVRDPAKLRVTHPQLTIMRGDVLEAASVDAAMLGQDAVVSALGHRRLFSPSPIQSEGTRNVLAAMSKHKVQRFVCETAIGLGNSAGRMGLPGTFFVLPVVLPIYLWDKARQEQLIAASDLEWVIVRPGILTQGAKRGAYRHGLNVGSYLWPERIGRADVADFMLKQLSDDAYLRMAPGVNW